VTDFPPLPTLDNLTDLERELIDATRSGAVLVCCDLPTEELVVDDDPAHEIRAQVLREMLLNRHGPLVR